MTDGTEDQVRASSWEKGWRRLPGGHAARQSLGDDLEFKRWMWEGKQPGHRNEQVRG